MKRPINSKHRAGHARRAGFSLAELMVVIVILGLLATLVVPNVIRNIDVAQGGKVKSDLTSIDSALDDYAINNGGNYPDSLESLVMRDENGYSFLKQRSVPRDPWGVEYLYEPPMQGETSPRIFTLGKDGLPGGEGANADISNFQLLGSEEH